MKHLENLTDDELGGRLRDSLTALPDAPLSWQTAAIKLWPTADSMSLKSLVQAVLNRMTALLAFDSWAAPGLAHGMRSQSAPTRHLLYTTQGRDIDLRISPESGTFRMTGQILGPDELGEVELTLAGSDAMPISTRLDALGEFRIGGLVHGTYLLTLRMGSDEIVIPSVEVGDPIK